MWGAFLLMNKDSMLFEEYYFNWINAPSTYGYDKNRQANTVLKKVVFLCQFSYSHGSTK